MDVIHHGCGIEQLDADYVAPGLACVYVIEHQQRLTIIESGTSHTAHQLLQYLERTGRHPEQVDYIFLTHIHLDHAAGAGTLMAECPNARLVVHERGVTHMANPAKLEAGTRAVYGDELYEKLYGRLLAIAPERIISATEGTEIDWQGRVFHCYDTPGHALHHICIHDSLSNGLFSGDTLGLSYRQFDTDERVPFLFVTTTPVHFDPIAMRQSIERMVALAPSAAYLTHYGPVVLNEHNVQQLLNSLEAFVAIAISQRSTDSQDVEQMSQDIEDWLVAQLRERGPLPMDEQTCRKWLATDAKLNAQGLAVWRARVTTA